MNLQRREEIKVIAECPNDRHWAQEMRRAVAELLAHIDALEQTAAERVIADGSRGPGVVPAVVVPELPTWESAKVDYDRSIHSNRDARAWADLFVATYPGLADKHDIMLGWFANSMMAMHDSLKQEARAVVVPELTDEEVDARLYASSPAGPDSDEDWVRFMRRQCRWAYFLAISRLRAIPADRELMRLVDELIRWHGLRPLDKRPDHAAALVEAIKALRANQGGAAT